MIAWAKASQSIESGDSSEIKCRSGGRFRSNDLYCDRKNEYVWRCKNDENCNVVYPLQNLGWKMWETWELMNGHPASQATFTGEFQEPSIEDLIEEMNFFPI